MARGRTATKTPVTELRLTGRLHHYPRWVVANCPELDVTTQGDDGADAKDMLAEAVQITLEEAARLGGLLGLLGAAGLPPVARGTHLKVYLKFRDHEERSVLARV